MLAVTSMQVMADVSMEDAAQPARANTGLRMGDHTMEGFVDFLIPLAERGNSLFLLNPRASLRDEGETEVNLGILWRHLLPAAGLAIGANVWFDSRESRHGNRFNQTGIGLELLGERIDARVNWYDTDDDLEPFNEFTTRETTVRTDISIRNDVVTRRQVDVDVASNATTDVAETTAWGAPYAEGHEILQDFERDVTATASDEIVIVAGTPVDNRTTLADDNELNGGTVLDNGGVDCP